MTSCPEKCGVFGRDIDKEAIFKFWQLDDASSDGISTLMASSGGSGCANICNGVFFAS